MSDLSSRSRALLEAAKTQGGPTRAQQAKMAAAVLGASTAAAAATGTTTGVSMVKLIGAGVAAVLVGVSGTVAVRRALAPVAPPVVAPVERVAVQVPAPAPVVEVIPAPVVVVPEPVVKPVQALPQVVATKPAVREAPVAPAPPIEVIPETAPVPAVVIEPSRGSGRSGAPDTAAAHVTALGAAMEALEGGNPAEALSVSRAARKAHPTGVLAPELAVVEIEALCDLKREAEAQEVADALPSSDRTRLVVERLRRSCVQLK